MAQLGLGHQSPSIPSPTRIQYRGPPIRRVACGAEFSVIVDVRGNVYTFGCPENGQLGTILVDYDLIKRRLVCVCPNNS